MRTLCLLLHQNADLRVDDEAETTVPPPGVVPTSHLKDKVVRPFPGASPFAAKAREIVEHREATRKQEARRQKREEEQGKPVWQRKKMDTTQTMDATMGTVQHSAF